MIRVGGKLNWILLSAILLVVGCSTMAVDTPISETTTSDSTRKIEKTLEAEYGDIGSQEKSVIAQKGESSNISNQSSLITVGEEEQESFETLHPYDGTGVVWNRAFHWPNASYISIHFSKFDLAPGDYVEISSPDGKYKYRYEGRGKVVRGGKAVISSFWASHIPGDTALVMLYKNNSTRGFGFEIDKWSHGFESGTLQNMLKIEDQTDIEAICGNDDKEWALCYDGTTIYEKSRAVARLLINGTSACTGWLIGSAGHLMTNNHCIDTQSDADNTDYEFMAEGATCQTDCSSGFACPGTVEASSGALVKTDFALDYTLVLLPTNLTQTYGFLQIRDALPNVGERIYIPQHPHAWGKQIAVNDDQTGGFCQIHSTNEIPCLSGPGDIGYLADTAGGSSGSPVISYSDNLVVALHHCANCPNRGVPIPSIIDHLGPDLPPGAVGDASCTLGLDLSFIAGTFNMDFTVGLTSPATWNVYLSVANVVVPLFSIPLPAINPPFSFPLAVPGFPSLGGVGVLTTLTTAGGIECSAWKTVNTGPIAP